MVCSALKMKLTERLGGIFQKWRGHGHIGPPQTKKSGAQAPRPLPPGSDAYDPIASRNVSPFWPLSLHCTLSLAAQCIVIGPVCLFATDGRAGGRAGDVRTLLQPARAQCLRLSVSERFFHFCLFCITTQTELEHWARMTEWRACGRRQVMAEDN